MFSMWEKVSGAIMGKVKVKMRVKGKVKVRGKETDGYECR